MLNNAVNRVYLSPPHINGREMKYIQQAFDNNWLAPLGANVDKLENDIKSFVHMPEALAVNSGTAAMHLALRYLGVGPGDVVFCSDVTFAASCNPITYLHAEPVFIDSDLESWGMSPLLLAQALEDYKQMNRLPKAVIVVDLYGLPARYDLILDICAQYGVPVVEDAAEALGSIYKGQMCGSMGDIAILSFNSNKIITTTGGGMVLARDKKAVKKMMYWATQAREPTRYYEHKEIGNNYRLSNICAGIGCGQMETIDLYIKARRSIYSIYVHELCDLPVSFYPRIENAVPNCWLSVMSLNRDCGVEADDIIDALAEENIESRPFWKPMHLQPVFAECSFYYNHDAPPVGEQLFETSLCLPSGSAMSQEILERIISVIRSCFPAESLSAFNDETIGNNMLYSFAEM